MLNSIVKNRLFFLRTETDRILFASILFSLAMVVAGIAYTGYLVFLFLVWNLFLAYLPYAITNWLHSRPGWIEDKRKFAVAFAIWLLFIPNSFYLLTDIFHLGEIRRVPLWFDLVLLFSFAWNGLILGIVSVRQMEKIAEVFFSLRSASFFIYPVMWLNALGVYIGRYLRYNSWDVLLNPFELITDIGNMILHPIQYRHAWGMVFCFSVFMTMVYGVMKKLGSMMNK
jgi:uncharacterized membrane protein